VRSHIRLDLPVGEDGHRYGSVRHAAHGCGAAAGWTLRTRTIGIAGAKLRPDTGDPD
jgi:hypothetical protein